MGRELISGGPVEVVLAASVSPEPTDAGPAGAGPADTLEVVAPCAPSDQPSPPAAREPSDPAEAERWAEAVALLAECLPPEARYPCPAEDLAAACASLRPDGDGDDADLWTAAAVAAVTDHLEADDWLATVLELVRAGPGTPAAPDRLVALSARCLDVDSAAADPALAPTLVAAFEAVLPVWRSLGAVDAEDRVTALGVWGLPLALARAWGGWLG
jgi:hypothetical protein